MTYTKTNMLTGKVYAGRTYGYGLTAQDVLDRRDRRHEKTGFFWSVAVINTSEEGTQPIELRYLNPAYRAMRGREQQLMDSQGGAINDPVRESKPTNSANDIRGVDAKSPLGYLFWLESNSHFGQIAAYTGCAMALPVHKCL